MQDACISHSSCPRVNKHNGMRRTLASPVANSGGGIRFDATLLPPQLFIVLLRSWFGTAPTPPAPMITSSINRHWGLLCTAIKLLWYRLFFFIAPPGPGDHHRATSPYRGRRPGPTSTFVPPLVGPLSSSFGI